VHLPHWPIDRLRRRRRELRHSPLVLIQISANRQIVTAVCPDAPASVRPGMSLAQARAHCAHLQCLAADPAADLRCLEALARWLMRFSPNVALCPPASIVVDVAGLDRLLGDPPTLARRVAAALSRLGLTARLAIAPTAAAAWGLAVFGHEKLPIVVGNGELLGAIAPLPTAALGLDSLVTVQLHALGVRTIGLLLKIPRSELAARFGPEILEKIDQATGAAPAVLDWLPYRAPIRARIHFDDATDSLEMIHLALREMLQIITQQLARRGLGARELRLELRSRHAAPIEKTIRLSRPSRLPADLLNLLRHATENLRTADGITAVGLFVSAAAPLGDEQSDLIGGEPQRNSAELDHLLERLRARLGEVAQWAQLVESHLPERAFRCRADAAATLAQAPAPAVARPLCLLPIPRCVKAIVIPSDGRDGVPISFTDAAQVHRLVHVKGPERIDGQWWNGHWKTRDYFDAQDDAGNRYWLFRVVQSGQWYLHGIFE